MLKKMKKTEKNLVQLSEIAAVYISIYCYDDFHVNLWCSGWIFYLKLCQ